MKTFLSKPGFEVIFSISLIVILGLPPVLLAQAKKNMDITIVNGDTTVNGKNIRSLSADERQEALKDINRMSNRPGNNNSGDAIYSFKRKDSVGGRVNRFELRSRKSGSDSLGKLKRMDFSFNYRNNDENDMLFRGRNFNPSRMRFDRRSSQNFDYVNTDKDGMSTHVRFHVSEVSNDDLKRMPHVEGSKFEITDLNLVPEFSTGKTLLMFNLPAKTTAEVKLTDDEGKILWNEKSAGGSFSKTFVLGLNGIYYLQIQQGHNVSVKKIMKDE
jgi:hypothetical protein